MIVKTGDMPLDVWQFGPEREFVGVSLPMGEGYAMLHVTVDPADPTGLRVYLYGNVSVG